MMVKAHVNEMKVLQEGEREELMHIFTTPTAENVLALKADLMIPWNKLRAMRRCAHYQVNYYIHVHCTCTLI